MNTELKFRQDVSDRRMEESTRNPRKKIAVCFEKILQKLFSDFGLTMNFEQYVLVGSTVRSYLSWLKDSGKLSVAFEDHMLLWKI